VVLTQQPPAKPGAPPPATLRATAGRADYAGEGEWLHLTVNPRVEDGALQLTADKVDVSRASGDAFAHGNVKASWTDAGAGGNGQPGRPAGGVALGGQGPSHVVSAEAQLRQPTGEATFRGKARLVAAGQFSGCAGDCADRERQTLMAHTTDAADPVRAVLVSAVGLRRAKDAAKTNQPSVIRVRGGDLNVLRCDAQGRDALGRSGHGYCRNRNGDFDLG